MSERTFVPRSSDVLVAALDERSNGDRVKVHFRRRGDSHVIDVRVFFRHPSGEHYPTQKGLTIELGELWNFGDALAKCVELAKGVRR